MGKWYKYYSYVVGESSLDLYFKRDEYEAWRDVYADST